MTNGEIVARAIEPMCAAFGRGDMPKQVALEFAGKAIAALSSAGRLVTSDATDWKARCEAAEAKWSHYAKLLDEQHGTPCEQIRHRDALTAAQAENEKLREALGFYATYIVTGERARITLASLSPPPLSPEKP